MTVAEKPWNVPIAEGELGGETQLEASPLGFDLGGENPSICYYVSAAALGRGEEELGRDMLVKFFQAMADKCMHPDYVVLVNAGVNLAKATCPVSPCLQSMEKRGTKVLVSSDSVDYLELNSEIVLGTLSSVEEILIVLNGVDKVVTL